MTHNLKLSEKNAKRLDALKKKHESKELRNKDWNFMLNSFLESVSDQQWEKAIEGHVPDDVIIRQALSNDETRKALAEFLRKNAKKEKAQKVEGQASPDSRKAS